MRGLSHLEHVTVRASVSGRRILQRDPGKLLSTREWPSRSEPLCLRFRHDDRDSRSPRRGAGQSSKWRSRTPWRGRPHRPRQFCRDPSHRWIDGTLRTPHPQRRDAGNGRCSRAGSDIADSGNTGNTAGIPHLHVSIQDCDPVTQRTASCPSRPLTFSNTDANANGLTLGQSYTAR